MERSCYQYSDIIVQPTRLEFEFQEGSKFVPSPKAVRVGRKREGYVMPRWQVTADERWVDAVPASGKDPKNVYVHIKASALSKPAGVYPAKVIFIATPTQNTPVFVDVILVVKPASAPPPPPPPVPEPAPKVAIFYPSGGETFFVNDTVKISWVTDRESDATLDIYLSVDGKWTTLATDVKVDDRVYPWRVEKTQICEEGIIRLSSVSIGNAPQSGSFRVVGGRWARMVNKLVKLIEWLISATEK